MTPNISSTVREKLCPAFCTRVIEIPHISISGSSPLEVSGDVESRNNNYRCTKINIFRFEVYDTVLYIESDCLVLKDLSSILYLGKNKYIKNDLSNMLVAATKEKCVPDKFDSRVLVIHPSKKCFDVMIEKTKAPSTGDITDVLFLNSFFPDWPRNMPSYSSLPSEYNAHRSTYRDLGLGLDFAIAHFSTSPKPWETNIDSGDDLDLLWKMWNRKSEKYEITWKEDQKWKKKNEKEAMKKTSKRKVDPVPQKPKNKNTSQKFHSLVSKRFQELKKGGMDSKDAMMAAREEFSKFEDKKQNSNVGSQVASLFGMPM